MRFSGKKKKKDRTSANCGRLQGEDDKHRQAHFLLMERVETVRTNAAASQRVCRKGQCLVPCRRWGCFCCSAQQEVRPLRSCLCGRALLLGLGRRAAFLTPEKPIRITEKVQYQTMRPLKLVADRFQGHIEAVISCYQDLYLCLGVLMVVSPS